MPNRLANETSPYLLQHANNPVDWYPWGAEAMEVAKALDLPIFLSVGYSACHWCHVMRRESFEDRATAAAMNRSFVSIKVDREERPEIDSMYMVCLQMLAAQGGWPMNLVLTPEGEPFYGGTYFPPVPRHGMPAFRQVLAAVSNAWRTQREKAYKEGERMTALLSHHYYRLRKSPDDLSMDNLLERALDNSEALYDQVNGGFRGLDGPTKFPQPFYLDFLLRTGKRGADWAIHTLKNVVAGGIRDHVGGGFHRYSVDAEWRIPHFEKMLTDNVLLAQTMTRAHGMGVPGMGAIAQETLDYVLRDMRSPEGGFYCSRDAESEDENGRHKEGAYYLWTRDEVLSLLAADGGRAVDGTGPAKDGGPADGTGPTDGTGPADDTGFAPGDADLFCRVYGITDAGNFMGRNVPHLPHDMETVAEREGMDLAELEDMLRRARAVLLEHRDRRHQPLRDEKILTSWNGLAIRALAEAGPALGRPDYTRAAEKAANFLLDAVRNGDRLHRVYTAGRVHVDGLLEDYGAMGGACLALYHATDDPRWLEEAKSLLDAIESLFWDDEAAVFYDTAVDAEPLILRPREFLDITTPTGSALALALAADLADLIKDTRAALMTIRVTVREMGAMDRYQMAMSGHLAVALQRTLS